MTDPKKISLVAPMYNEQEVVRIFFGEVEKCFAALEYDFEIVCVNDGSQDSTMAILLEESKRNKKNKNT